MSVFVFERNNLTNQIHKKYYFIILMLIVTNLKTKMTIYLGIIVCNKMVERSMIIVVLVVD